MGLNEDSSILFSWFEQFINNIKDTKNDKNRKNGI